MNRKAAPEAIGMWSQQLADKGGEFYMAMSILSAHTTDIILEAREIVLKAKADFVTFEEVENAFRVISGGQYEFDKDIYAKQLKQFFDEDCQPKEDTPSQPE